ncbi:MAG: M24 family metallopeptidase [Caldilineales bacterium]|nr:M24 family metallopeptidase [Caldilineales bacterium]MCW5857359.1 aminopeptidase P family protein [Caldilineales bacterium]
MNATTLSTIQAMLQRQNLDGWLLYCFRDLNPIAKRLAPLPPLGLLSRRWAYWIPAAGEPAWLVHAIERGGFAQRPERVESYSSWASFEAALLRLTGGPKRIACEYSPRCGIPYASYLDAGTAEHLRDLGFELHASADLIQAVLATWTPLQLASHRRAAAACLAAKDAAFAFIARRLADGAAVTEVEAQQVILDHFAAAGIDPDHPPIVAVNAHAGNPHYAPDPEHPTPIHSGDLILIDLWGRVAGDPEAVFADITWMGFAGPQPPAEMQRVFDVVARARDAGVQLVQERVAAGARLCGWEVDDAVRGVIAQAGYADYFIHRSGHSLDTAIHGSGVNIDNLEMRDTRALIPHIGFTIEPGVYLPDFGVRLEINLYIHPDRAEVTTLPLQTAFITMAV